MKKVFRKSISAILISAILLCSSPLEGFLGANLHLPDFNFLKAFADKLLDDSSSVDDLEGTEYEVLNEFSECDFSKYGEPLTDDPYFISGLNDTQVYDNSQSGNVTIERTNLEDDIPSPYGYALKIKTVGSASPGIGGFYQGDESAVAGGVYYHCFVAKIPVGYTVESGANTMGYRPKKTWLTPQLGTGDWQIYIYRWDCGNAMQTAPYGTSFGYIYLVGETPSAENPIEWYVCYSNLYDDTGYACFFDDGFDYSTNGISEYNNSGSLGTVTVDKIGVSSDCPTTSSYMLSITSTGTTMPALGGFKQYCIPVEGVTYYHKICAKIPVGYRLEDNRNYLSCKVEWLTSQEGTGEWENYTYKVTVDKDAADLGAFGHVSIYPDDLERPDDLYEANMIPYTSNQTFTWYVASTIIFCDKIDGVARNLISSVDAYTTYNDHYYARFDDKMTWKQAELVCRSMGGHLATVTSDTETGIMKNLLSNCDGEYYHIGGSHLKKNVWTWVTGEEFSYTNFRNSHTFNDLDYCIKIMKGSASWYSTTMSDDIKYGFILEIDDYYTPTYSIEYDGNIYSIFNCPTAWENAKTICENMGGHLVTITSKEEQNAIEKLTPFMFQNFAYIGATDGEVEGDWKWITGESFTYSNWYGSEPNNNDGSGNSENYGTIYKNDNQAWNDVSGAYLTGFICEFECSSIAPYKRTNYGNNCYEFFDNNVSWEVANSIAKSKGGHLVTVNSKEEDDFLIANFSNSVESYWIGLVDKNRNQNYQWLTGESMTFSNWGDNEPNCSLFIEHYGSYYLSTSKWNDLPNTNAGFVIEYENNSFDSKGVRIGKNGDIQAYPKDSENSYYSIPDGVTRISANAFSNSVNLLGVVVPESVIAIDDDAFCDADIKLYVYENSYALQFAIDNNKSYEIIDDNGYDLEHGKLLHIDVESVEGTLQYGVDGSWEKSSLSLPCETSNMYFCYDISKPKYTVNALYEDGEVITLSNNEMKNIELVSTQNVEDKEWQIGSNEVTIEYYCHKAICNVVVEDNDVSSISVSLKNKCLYEHLDFPNEQWVPALDDAEITIIYKDETVQKSTCSNIKALTGYDVFVFSDDISGWNIDTQKSFTFYFKGKPCSVSVNYASNPAVSAKIASNPNKTTYIVGDTFDPTGFSMLVKYKNGISKTQTEDIKYSVGKFAKEGKYIVKATYLDQTVKFSVSVKSACPISISIQTLPTKREYYVGDLLQPEGLTAKVCYDNEMSQDISAGFYYSYDFSVSGKRVVTVYYTQNDVTVSTTFEVNVKSIDCTVSVDDVVVKSRNEFEVPVRITNNPGLCGYSVTVKYDSTAVVPLSVSLPDGMEGSLNDSISVATDNSFKVVWTGADDYTIDGVLFNITFSALDNAYGSSVLELSYDQDDTFNSLYEDVIFHCTSGVISVESENSPRFVLNEASLSSNGTYVIPLSVVNNCNLCSAIFELQFDATIFELEDVFLADSISGTVSTDSDGNNISVTLSSLTNIVDGVLAYLVFKPISDSCGEYEIGLACKQCDSLGEGTPKTEGCKVVLNNTKEPLIYGEKARLVSGKINSVPILIKDNTGIMGLGLKVNYDPSVVTPVEITRGEVLKSGNIGDTIGIHTGSFNVIWNDSDDVDTDGVLFVIDFMVSNESNVDSTEISIEYLQEHTFNSKWDDVQLNCSNLMLEHIVYTVSYVWSDDGSSCTATAICKNDETDKVTENATISSVTTPATCEDKGVTTYIATFTNSLFKTQTKNVDIKNPLNHDYIITYTWADDGRSCTATAICKNDKTHIVTENATVESSVTIPAACEEKGTTTYTATFTNSLFVSQKKELNDINQLNHDYTISYVWSDDGRSCTATATCKNDKTHIVTENATVESSVTTPAACEEKGTTTYTATFTNSLFVSQEKELNDINKLNHDYTISYVWSEDGSSCTAIAICKNNGTHVVKETATVESSTTTPATSEEKATTTNTATFTSSLFATQTKSVTFITSYSKGDIIEFGWYPQTKETDSTVISALNELAGDNKEWTSYNYYSGTGTADDGQMTPSNYMRYKDVLYGATKYRGVVFDAYRPYCTGYTFSTDNSYQDDNGYAAGTTYWFKYEPIKWRVLNPATGLVLSETIIDAQTYNNYVLGADSYYYGNSDETYYANNYANSSIRQWLNNDFYNTAFSTSQQNIIQSTKLDNSAYSSSYSAYDSASTTDKVFLLSYSDAIKSSYGFSSNSKRIAQGSDYAKCQGLVVYPFSSYCGNSYWCLRSAGDGSDGACRVDYDGGVSRYYGTNCTCHGVRSALTLNLTSDIFQSSVNDICNFRINDSDSLITALEAAQDGATIILENDMSLNDETVRVKAGRTLDLNGYDLECDNLLVTGNIIDTSENKAVIKADTFMLPDSGDYLPIYNSEKGGYSFYAMKVNVYRNKNNQNKFGFRFDTSGNPGSEDYDLAKELIGNTDKSIENARIKAVVTFSWTDGEEKKTLPVSFDLELLQSYLKKDNGILTITVNGLETIESDANVDFAFVAVDSKGNEITSVKTPITIEKTVSEGSS